jgi:predicted HicB family RNase H-like nuclease
MAEQRQLNVNLPAELVRECKHAAIDADMSLGAFVAEALQKYLSDLRRFHPPLTAPQRVASDR